MLAINRRKKIEEMIDRDKVVYVQQLAKLFNVSEETIRRDLEKLEDLGMLKRTYGGAVANESSTKEVATNIRMVKNKDEKETIALKAIEIIIDGETLMLDSSTTSLYIAREIKRKRKNVTVITNSITIVEELELSSINVILCGGSFNRTNRSLNGNSTLNMLKNYCVNKAFVSCRGIDEEVGITDSDEDEAVIKQQMLKSADVKILVFNDNKVGKRSFVKWAEQSEFDYVITNTENETVKRIFDVENSTKKVELL